MAYFKINGNDYSACVSQLKVSNQVIYKSVQNAAGNTVAKYVATKRVFTVGFIPLDSSVMAGLHKDMNNFKVTVSYREPSTNTLVENVQCIIPLNEVEYYTIQADNVMYKPFVLTLQEL